MQTHPGRPLNLAINILAVVDKVRDPSELLTSGGLTTQQEGLRVFPFATDFERAEVLVPEPVWSIRLQFSPHFQLVKIFRSDLALAKPALVTKGHAGQLFLDTLLFFRIAATCEVIGQVQETLSFLLPGFKAGLDELINDHVTFLK